MPLKQYGVLKGRPIQRKLGAGNSPHYQIHIVDDETDYRIAVNVKSSESPSEVEYLVDDRFRHPITEIISDLPVGFNPLKSETGSGALDYIRGNLFDRSKMRPLPFNVPGFDNDLNEKIDAVVQRAMATEDALIYAFGERWGPEKKKKDAYFGFLPGNGIHDIHMNQGNVPKYQRDDGVWQDGGLLIQFPEAAQWVAVFLKFQSQAWHTDDRTGHVLAGGGGGTDGGNDKPGEVWEPQGTVRIVAALVNSVRSPEAETVTLLNATPREIDLRGWHLADKMKKRHPLGGKLGAGEILKVAVREPMQLSNNGGIITLLDDQGLKVDGVSYTKAQADNPGWTIVF